MIRIAQFMVHPLRTLQSFGMLFAVELVMDTNERQIALSVLEGLREDLVYARLNNGSRVLDVADLRQYIYEQMGRIRTNAHVAETLYGNTNSHTQDICTSIGDNGKAHF
jgi:hypothetical protein